MPEFASRDRHPPATGASPSRAPPKPDTCWSRRRGRPCGPPVRSGRSGSGSGPGEAPTSPRWPSLVREKIRRLELAAGAPNRNGYRNPVRVFATPEQRRLEREVGDQAEKAYRRFVQDFRATGKKGAGAATGARISVARKGQAARQEQAPDPAL